MIELTPITNLGSQAGDKNSRAAVAGVALS